MAQSKNLFFHSAEVYLKSTAANPTPRKVGVIQEVSIEVKSEIKELYGERQYAEDSATGNSSISGKYKSGEFDPAWVNDVLLNGVRTTGMLQLVRGEEQTIATAATTVTGAADFSEDYGVVYAATGQEFKRVAATPAIGEYAVNETTGVYAFNAGENGVKVLHTYLKETVGGETYTVNNPLAGDTVQCSLLLYKTSRAQTQFGLRLARAAFESLSFGFKLNEYAMPEGSFKGFADPATGKVFEIFRG